jgi:hypothetical protein
MPVILRKYYFDSVVDLDEKDEDDGDSSMAPATLTK